MVKIRGPVLSQAASGTIGKVATYSTAKGRAYLKFKPTPAQPRSGLQVSMRAIMQFLSQQWQNLQAAKQATWADAYPGTDPNNYNSFIKHNLKRWRRQAPPSKQYPATEDGTTGGNIDVNATGAVRHAVLEVDLDFDAADNWTIMLFHSTIANPEDEVSQLIHIYHVEDTTPHYWTHSPLAAGTHYYRAVPTTDDGYVDWADDATDSAVVT